MLGKKTRDCMVSNNKEHSHSVKLSATYNASYHGLYINIRTSTMHIRQF